MLTVGVLFGGRSGEHDVSLCSAASIVSSLDTNRFNVVAVGIERDGRWHVQDKPEYTQAEGFGKVLKLNHTGDWYLNHYERDGRLHLIDMITGRNVILDVIFPAVHGTFCEDGTLQGLLELACVPFVGADVTGSAIGMDKDVAKRLLRDGGIPVVPWICFSGSSFRADRRAVREEIGSTLGYPLFIKPAAAGSSVGVSRVRTPAELDKAIETALRHSLRFMAEKAVNAREIECAVLGNDSPVASCTGEVVPRREFYSYEAKYLDSDGAELLVPAAVDSSVEERIRSMAVTGYSLLNCAGMARVDFFLDKDTGDIYLNEINTLPGFTSISMYPRLWNHSGIPYGELLGRLIELALDRYREKSAILKG